MSKQYPLTPEQLALQAERRAKSQNKIDDPRQKAEDAGVILSREWMQLKVPHTSAIKVLTWNVCSFFTHIMCTLHC